MATTLFPGFRSPHVRTAALWLALLLPGTTGAAVYRCSGDDGSPHFSQFPCGDGRAVVIEPLRTVRIPPISDAEHRLLETLEQQHRAEARARAKARRRAARSAQAQRRERRQRCEAARAALADLERHRRKGYSLSEARALDRREDELEAERRSNC